MYIAASNDFNRFGPSYLITAGTDMRIRYWDMQMPSKSYIIAKAAMDAHNSNDATYRYEYKMYT